MDLASFAQMGQSDVLSRNQGTPSAAAFHGQIIPLSKCKIGIVYKDYIKWRSSELVKLEKVIVKNESANLLKLDTLTIWPYNRSHCQTLSDTRKNLIKKRGP